MELVPQPLIAGVLEGSSPKPPLEGSAPPSSQCLLTSADEGVEPAGPSTAPSLTESTDSLSLTTAAVERAALMMRLDEAAAVSSGSPARGPLTLLLLGAPADPRADP